MADKWDRNDEYLANAGIEVDAGMIERMVQGNE